MLYSLMKHHFGSLEDLWGRGLKKRGRIAPTVNHSVKINIWAAFSSMGTFALCIFDHNMVGDTLKDSWWPFTCSSTCFSRERLVFSSGQWSKTHLQEGKRSDAAKYATKYIQLMNHYQLEISYPHLNPIDSVRSRTTSIRIDQEPNQTLKIGFLNYRIP